MKLIKDTYYSWDAEVVFITSNWQGNQEMMEGCKDAGIPAFVRFRISRFQVVMLIDFLGRSLGLLILSCRKHSQFLLLPI